MVNQHILQRPQLFTKEPIAIVGLGGIFPDAKNIEQFWENIKSGKNSIKEVNPRRWDPNYYFDEDRDIPDKTYTKIGAFIDDFEFNGLEFRIPPNVTTQMDQTQLLALAAAKQALEDANYNNPEFPRERTAVIIGNSSGGEHRETYDRRIMFPEVIKAFKHTDMYGVLPPEVREDLIRQIEFEYKKNMIEINEDSMPGELSNVIAGRIAAVFNLRGKNLTSDAACASSLAAIDIAYKGLNAREFDAAVVGGSDKSMSPGAYVKFSKIGALSPTGSYPFDKRANGFVMGEGAGIFVVKRLSDAIKSGDKIYALITGVGSSSDGKGKGITAPNPIGQELAIQRAFEDANINPKSIQLVEAHGTSTAVGDVVEVQSLENVFKKYDITPQSVKLGSIKSQIGHLKSAAGAAAIVKTALALHYKVFPPSINFETPNPKINWKISPFIVQTISEPWNIEEGGIRRAGVSSFGFGGTNFHLIMEEYDPTRNYFIQSPDNEVPHNNLSWEEYVNKYNECVSESVQLSAKSNTELETSIKNLIATLPNDHVMTNPNSPSLLEIIKKVKYNYKHPVRIGITLPSFEDTKKVLNQAIEIINDDNKIKIGRAKGIFTSTNLEKGKIAFVFPGQGSQYVNMLKALSKKFAIVNSTFKEADEILADFLDLPLSSYIFPSEINFKNENMLRQTQITQPAMLTADIAIYRLLLEFGIVPDLVAGHSLGEFAALVAAGVITFENALKAVAIRGKAMAEVTSKDKGTMASITGKYEEIEKIIKKAGGYVVAANKNSINQTVISGNTKDVENAIELFKTKGMNVIPLSVSAAFHTKIVEPAGKPLSEFLDSITFNKPKIPISSNVTGEFYPNNPMEIKELLKKQVGAPVEWTKQVESMYSYGANFFIEVGPKRALSSFVTETLVDKNILTVITNHPKGGDVKTFNDAVSAAGAFGIKLENITSSSSILNKEFIWYKQPISTISKQITTKIGNLSSSQEKAQSKLNRLGINSDAIVVTGVGLGLPGSGKEIFREDNFDRILEGQNYIQQLPREKLDQQLNKNIRRLIKQSSGNAEFHSPKKYSEVINLAGVAGTFDLTQEYMVKDEFSSTFDITTGLAIAAGLEALKDAGIPLIREYRKTTTGSFLPGDWILPEELQEGTGIIFASAFPGYDNFAKEIREYHEYKFASNSKKLLNDLYAEVNRKITNQTEKDYLINKIEQELIDFDKMEQYNFNRKLLLNVLSMGHAQFAQLIKAKGPNTQINAACASTTQAVGIATDWIRTGRCDRVIVISADDITSDNLFEWLGSGFLASGAASTKDKVEEAALPFDRRRGGMIIGMGAAALVVESDKEATRRGITPIVEILGTQFSNSSFHGTRLDVNHVSQELNKFMDNIEKIHNLSANEIGNSMMFMSHETYTPRRGGSASAEIKSLRDTFGKAASKIYIANTKGFTGHAMGAGIEDVVAIKAIEKNKIPPIANFKEPDPDLGDLQLSKGGVITVNYVLRLAAGFGSQIAFVLYKRRLDGKRTTNNYNKWLSSLGTNAKELTYHGKTLIIKDTGRLIPKKTETILVKPTSKTSIIKPQEPIKVGKFVDNVLSIVSDKTGYPIDMLDPNLDMEADLGIDTVKQAEIFGVIREEYNLEQDENLQLSNFPTIKAVAEYFEKRIDNTTPITSNIEPSNDMVEYTNREDISVKILEIVSEKTGYPVNMLDPQLDMEADLGIDTVKQAELFAVIRESWSIPRDDGINISDYPTLNHVVDFVMNNSKVSTSDITIKSDIPTMDQTVKKVISLSKDRKSIEEKILEIVSDKTGYPVDMLDPKLDMEADLGIDTVKQAELFGVIREEWGIERDDNTVISNYPTLNHVVDFVIDKKSELRSHQPTKIPTTKAAKTQTINNVDVEKRILEIVSEKTGYPIDMLDPQLDMEADLGIDTVKQAELFGIIREEWQIERDENTLISDYPTLNHVVNFVLDNTSTRNDLTQEISHTPVNQEVELMEDKRRVSLDENKIIEIISKYTGYPSSMIDTSLSFSTDLGIDSELFNTIIQEMNSKFSLNLNNQNKVDSIDEILKLVKPIDDIILEVTKTEIKPEPKNELQNSQINRDEVVESIIQIVSEKTGYPVDMLDPQLDMEADLGIDTVKQAELFASVREKYGIPPIDGLIIAEFNTIEKFSELILYHSKSASPIDRSESLPIKEMGQSKTHRYVIRLNEDPKKFEFSGDGLIISYKNTFSEDLSKELNLKRIPSLKENISISDNSTLILLNPEIKNIKISMLFEFIKEKIDQIARIVLAIQYTNEEMPTINQMSPLQGAIGGMLKSIQHEFSKISTTIILFQTKEDLLNEIGGSAQEVIYHNGKRYVVALKEENLPISHWKLDEDSVLLASGGAQGITFKIIKEIITPTSTIILFGRTSLSKEAEKLAELTDEQLEQEKWKLRDTLINEGEKVTPVILENKWSKIRKSVDVYKAISELLYLGCTVIYKSVDISNEEDISTIFNELTKELNGKTITHFIHGAGIEISRPTISKSVEEFNLVYNVKTSGLENIIPHLGDNLKQVVLFSSVAGRFGNATQIDYSAANEYIAKKAIEFQNQGIKTVVFDWSVWDEVGMGMRGSTMKVLEAIGVSPIPLGEGIQRFKSEIEFGTEIEIIISGTLGKFGEKIPRFEYKVTDKIMVDSYDDNTGGFNRKLTYKKDKYLEDHKIEGKPVLPGVMGLETISEVVSIVSEKPINQLKNIDFNTPIKILKEDGLDIYTFVEAIGGKYNTYLKSKFIGPDGKQLGDLREHFLVQAIPGIRLNGFNVIHKSEIAKFSNKSLINKKEIYDLLFHGNSYQVLEKVNNLTTTEIITTYTIPKKKMFSIDTDLEINPLAIEAAFQSAGLHLLISTKTMGLPSKVGNIIFFNNTNIVVYIIANFLHSDDVYSYYNIDLLDKFGKIVIKIYNYQMIHTGTIDHTLKDSRVDDNQIQNIKYMAGTLRKMVVMIETEALTDIIEEDLQNILTSTEMIHFNSLKIQKKRNEWLGGRIASKMALILKYGGVLSDFEILKDENRSPFIMYKNNKDHISITHSNGIAAAIVGEEAIDIEKIEKRDKSFITEAFTKDELRRLNVKDNDFQKINQLWTIKEAHLKRMRLGLKINLKEVSITQLSNKTAIVVSPQGKSNIVTEVNDFWAISIALP